MPGFFSGYSQKPGRKGYNILEPPPTGTSLPPFTTTKCARHAEGPHLDLLLTSLQHLLRQLKHHARRPSRGTKMPVHEKQDRRATALVRHAPPLLAPELILLPRYDSQRTHTKTRLSYTRTEKGLLLSFATESEEERYTSSKKNTPRSIS